MVYTFINQPFIYMRYFYPKFVIEENYHEE